MSALYLYRDNWRELLHMLPLQAPLRYYYVTSPYGMRTNKKTGVLGFIMALISQAHGKLSCAPPSSGIVTFAGRDGGFGKVVKVQHAHGIETVYAHLSSVLVSKGSFVTPQDILGTMGNTGHSDGMHLHYEIRIDGKSKDPEDFFAYGHKLSIIGALSGKCKKVFLLFVFYIPATRSLARWLQFVLYLCPDADETTKRNIDMRTKKQSADKMAIKFVEFDQNDKPISENVTPLGLYLHEYDSSEFEREMTAQLSAMAAKR